MKAIVLAAGFGKRLRPLSDSFPKPLMPILGRPLLWHIIMKLRKCGIADIGINLHHNHHMVKKFLEHNDLGVDIKINHEENIMGVGGGIKGFKEFISDEDYFIVHNGDVLSDISFEKLIDESKAAKEMCLMALHDHPPYNNVSIDKNNTILDIRDTLKPGGDVTQLAYTGISLMSAGILKYIPDGPSDIIPVLIDIIKSGKGMVKAVVMNGCAWKDIGTAASYLNAHEDILIKRKPLIDESLIPDRPVFIDRGAMIEDAVEIRGFVSAGRNCILKKGCHLENCVIWEDAVIEENSVIVNSIAGKGWVVHADR
jgi:NDP-sugar pyrophosphorylase family protein